MYISFIDPISVFLRIVKDRKGRNSDGRGGGEDLRGIKKRGNHNQNILDGKKNLLSIEKNIVISKNNNSHI